MYNNDLVNELGSNFIEYAVAVNSDRAIPNATDGLKPVAKRILYCAYDCGFKYEKPHVKAANIVGNVMADWHPHGDSSIYGALVRLSQNWVMRYPLIDWHGANGNIAGDGPAHQRYTEARLAKIAEDGMLANIKKDTVDFIDNYSETKKEPIELPAIFPNLLCNPNSGIGVALASSWGCHNLGEVAQAIYDYMDGKEPMIYPDFPTGGIVINKNDVPNIMKTGHGSVKIRAKHEVDDNKIVFTELPYGTGTEVLMSQIGDLCDKEEIIGVSDIRDESNKKGIRLVIECDKDASIAKIITKLFTKTDLQTSFSYNQVALVDKTPTELNLVDCIKIYINHNVKCITREAQHDLDKSEARLHIIEALIKALNYIDEIITTIKASSSTTDAKNQLMTKWKFDDIQAQAILDMKLARLAKLEKDNLVQEQNELTSLIKKLRGILNNPQLELRTRLTNLVNKYGDERRTKLIQLEEPKEDKEIINVEPEKCVVIMTKSGNIKRIPAANFKTQRRNTKGVKTQDDITNAVIRTNTIDSLMIFTNKGKMYRLLVDNVPTGTAASKGQSIKSLISMDTGEEPVLIYSIYRETDAQFVLFTTKNGLVKKTPLSEYIQTKKNSGIAAIKFKEGDELASVSLIKDEDIIIITVNGVAIHIKSSDIPISSRVTMGNKGITLGKDDYVISALPIRDKNDNLAVFTQKGYAKQTPLKEFPSQGRAGKGLSCYKLNAATGLAAAAALVNDEDNVLILGDKSSVCLSAKEIPNTGRAAAGNIMIKNNHILGVSKT